ncbi:uncharacterized protein LOC133639376 [Entelurus aequoreus]|uniref:uncharacterized protein LOC133639376 n=1 Tax=Entelurus aequoreus TaxID=161455 RepID=UPI002B1DDC20|nr:uncharacterized protein LOC133639376 [Entelurus aequoreus]
MWGLTEACCPEVLSERCGSPRGGKTSSEVRETGRKSGALARHHSLCPGGRSRSRRQPGKQREYGETRHTARGAGTEVCCWEATRRTRDKMNTAREKTQREKECIELDSFGLLYRTDPLREHPEAPLRAQQDTPPRAPLRPRPRASTAGDNQQSAHLDLIKSSSMKANAAGRNIASVHIVSVAMCLTSLDLPLDPDCLPRSSTTPAFGLGPQDISLQPHGHRLDHITFLPSPFGLVCLHNQHTLPTTSCKYYLVKFYR